jgi:hypothetical protein
MTLEKDKLEKLKSVILHESKNVASFVVIGETLYNLYYVDKLVKNQKEFLSWTKQNLGFSKSTTYEYIISYRVYNDIVRKLPPQYQPPLYQSHCQLLAKVPEDQLIDVWIKVNDSAPNGIVTTSLLEQMLKEMNFKSQKRKKKKFESDEDEGYETPEGVDDVVAVSTPKKRLSKINALVPSQGTFDKAAVYELAKSVVAGNEFDKVCFTPQALQEIEQEAWYGRIYCDLSTLLPFSKHYLHDGVERYLQMIFTRYANKEYDEGVFIVRAEFGNDWFTPILQHPFCILRQKSDLEARQEFNSFIVFYMGFNVNEFTQCFRTVGFVPGFNIWYGFM